MKEHAESLVSYVLGIGFLLYSSVLTHANEIMTLGGLLLLGARLYVDGGKAIRTYKRNKRLDRKIQLPPA
ncbi:putative membrane protein [Rhizobium phage Paso]|uniref:Putative membrane protein n=1 Tax=Rhizobium phage Paso TaxID=2767574 RepID=A0A7L8G4S4_9CAUD|nr:putative membrane protein [Rhizobium phage Paso]